MTPRIPEEFSTRLIDWSPFVIMGNTMPPRDPDEDEEDEDEEERFVHNANIEHYRRLIAESEFDPSRDEGRHKMLLTPLAEEVAKDKKPR
jgi:hypothetical protein